MIFPMDLLSRNERTSDFHLYKIFYTWL